MCAHAGFALRKWLKSVLAAVEVGDWRRARRLLMAAQSSDGGLEPLVRGLVALEHAVRAMQLQAQGFASEASDEFDVAATQLPRLCKLSTATPGRAVAVIPPEPDDPRSDDHLTWRTARVIWRGQFELGDLRRRFAPGRMRARDELVEACIEHLSCVEFDPFVWPSSGQAAPDDGIPVEPTRQRLCRRATRLRQFGDPTRGELTQSVWRDIGAYRRLRGAALTQLATRVVPAPWCGSRGTSGLKICRGRLRAWQYAHLWHNDLKYWNRTDEMP